MKPIKKSIFEPIIYFMYLIYVARTVKHLLFVVVLLIMTGCSRNPGIELEKDDRIAIVGNSLAERMQHDGWLETYLQSTHPEHNLVIRNLGYSGDQVHYRPRAHEGFGDSDTHLTKMGANVIFAFFGYNESYNDKPEEFKEQLRAFVNHTRQQKYDSVNVPRIVLFSPIAHENLETKNLADGSENNRRLAAYTNAMAEVAKEMDVAFVDLFNTTREMYEASKRQLTINGIHLNEEGNRQVALYITESALGHDVTFEQPQLDSLRSAVVEKNTLWFHKYRSISGNDVWGTRSSQDGNYATLQRELVMLEVMTANRDKKIWARAKGEDIQVDDSNVPTPLIVGTHITRDVTYIDPVEAISRMTVPNDLQVNLFASEQEFPEVINPVALQVDTKGRIWAASWATYPKWQPKTEMNDRLVYFEDEDGDGKADKATTFAYVPHPTGFEFWNGGVIVVSAPDILFLKDTTGDGVADVRTRIFGGIGSDDTHHTANNLIYGPDGNIYYQRGIFILENIETPWRTSDESGSPGLYRFNPRTFDFSYVVENTPNAHGISIDKWGNQYITDGTTGKAFQVYQKRTVTERSDVSIFDKRPLFQPSVRPVTANQLLSSPHFPEAYNNNFLVYNVIGFQGIKRYKLNYLGEGMIEGKEAGNLLYTGNDPTFAPRSEATPRVVPKDWTGDPNFRPTDGVVGFDGALYFADWQNAVITHSPYNLRDASRDQSHGRIYRITAKNRPLMTRVKVDGEPVENLLELFKHPADGIRHAVRVELSERDTDEVIRKAQEWATKLDPMKKEDAIPLLEILWLHQQHNVQNRELLVQMLKSPEEQARIAAQKVAWFWSDHLKTHREGGKDSKVSGMQFRTYYETFWIASDSAAAATISHASHKVDEKKAVAEKKADPKKLDLRDKPVAAFKMEASLMKFNIEEFTVRSGQTIELTLDNLDLMQHNILVVEPGAADEVAQQAIALGAKGQEKNWVPDNKKILFASKLLDPNKAEVLTFKAPSTPGDYQFVCTFPGHAPVMRGIMRVVK